MKKEHKEEEAEIEEEEETEEGKETAEKQKSIGKGCDEMKRREGMGANGVNFCAMSGKEAKEGGSRRRTSSSSPSRPRRIMVKASKRRPRGSAMTRLQRPCSLDDMWVVSGQVSVSKRREVISRACCVCASIGRCVQAAIMGALKMYIYIYNTYKSPNK